MKKEINLQKKPQFFQKIHNESRQNLLPSAILWVETIFRPLWFRVIEYIFLLLCISIKSGHVQNITIGLAQLKYRMWKEFLKYNGKPMSFFSFEDPVTNYQAISWYLSFFQYDSSLV